MSPPGREVFELLYDAYGPQHWWPAQSAWEVMVGAVLVQNTTWRNAERAIANLRSAGKLGFDKLRTLSAPDLAELIRPAGYYRVKASRLLNLVALIEEDFTGSLENMEGVDTSELRQRLLSVNGIGPETADAILCYALNRPIVVADAYAQRIYARHGWVGPEWNYDGLQRALSEGVGDDCQVCNEMHALIVKVAHEHCRREPICPGCPLETLLPECGTIDC